MGIGDFWNVEVVVERGAFLLEGVEGDFFRDEDAEEERDLEGGIAICI